MTTALPAALALAERFRLPVFPVAASKAPTCPHGFRDATAEPDAIRDLWRRYPGPLVGVPTGAATGLDVLDIDAPRHPEAAAWWQANRDTIPATRTHATRSGGLHVLFRHAEGVRNSAGRIAPGIDVRGEGGAIRWWPAAGCTVLDRSPRAIWPGRLLALALPPPEPPRAALVLPAGASGDAARRYALGALRNAVERVARAGEGTRNATLNAECFAMARFIPAALAPAEVADALTIAARHAGLTTRETITTLTSALRAGGAA